MTDGTASNRSLLDASKEINPSAPHSGPFLGSSSCSAQGLPPWLWEAGRQACFLNDLHRGRSAELAAVVASYRTYVPYSTSLGLRVKRQSQGPGASCLWLFFILGPWREACASNNLFLSLRPLYRNRLCCPAGVGLSWHSGEARTKFS